MEKKIIPGRVWSPPDGAQCKKCLSPIAFRQLPSGKWCPCEPDGSDHWDLCRERQVKLGIRHAGPNEMYMGTSKRRDTSQPLWDGKGVPWAEEPPTACSCGKAWATRLQKNNTIMVRCKCKRVRIETAA